MTTPAEDPGPRTEPEHGPAPHAPLPPPVLEDDQDAPPRPEEDLADAERDAGPPAG